MIINLNLGDKVVSAVPYEGAVLVVTERGSIYTVTRNHSTGQLEVRVG